MKQFIHKCWSWCVHRDRTRNEIIFHAYPEFLYAWPLIFLGYFFYMIDGMSWVNPKVEAWLYITVAATVLLTMGIDMHRNIGIFWLVLIGFMWFAALWLRDVKGFTIFDTVLNYFETLNPVYSKDFGYILSLILSVFWVIMLVHSWLNDRWRITPNEFEHYVFGRSDKSMGRGAKQVGSDYPDIWELFLCLAGTLVIKDAQGQHTLGKIENVPFLPFRMAKINRILESIQVTPGGDEEDHAEDHDHEAGDDQNLIH